MAFSLNPRPDAPGCLFGRFCPKIQKLQLTPQVRASNCIFPSSFSPRHRGRQRLGGRTARPRRADCEPEEEADSRVHHIFNSEVGMALEFLKGRRVVEEVSGDRTEKVLDALRARSTESKRLGPCPAELSQSIVGRTLVSLYAQRSTTSARGMRLVPVGVLCLHCQCHEIDMSQPYLNARRELRIS